MVVDVSSVDIPEVTIKRLDQDIFNIDTTDIEGETKKLQKKYGQFYSTYITGILNNGGINDSSYSYRIKQFISDPDMRTAFNDCHKKYPGTDQLKEKLTDVYKHFKHYFKNRNVPKAVTMISGFNYSVVNVDSTLAIGLEMYLGSDNVFYQMLALPRYKTAYMNEENIIPDAVRTWMLTEFPYNMDKSDFLSQIIYMGKIIYLTDALLPETHDSLKIQYTQKQLEYCNQNEFNLWSYFIAQKLLYTTNQADIMKYTSDGPFTSALSKEAPARIGYWVGWQIIKQYMKNNSETTIEALMKETDAQKILNKSKYKPSK